ncbi:MAG: TrkH family potassium uptake protein [Clostridia bacterium]|nr:TrkH family potassium uptake protein [Clostridia bacterium]
MNLSMIRYILGNVLAVEGLLMAPCSIVGYLNGEAEAEIYLIIGVCTLLMGLMLRWKKPENAVFYLKEGCVSTALSWTLMSIMGCLPFVLTGEIPGFVDAFFETVSGFTTTGASVLSDVEALSHVSLFWRSFTHWIGGMGVLVFVLAVVPMNGGSHMNLMRAESPGPTVGKLVPRLRHTARILYLIYVVMTAIQIVLLLAGDMPLFDAVTLSFGTAGTGGFGIKNDSIAGYSAYCQWVITVFMILFGINFNAYYLILLKHVKDAFSIEEVRAYLAIILGAAAVIFFSILDLCEGVFDALTQAFFQVGSVITTTGYSTVDFDLWPTTAKLTMVLLMFIGACAGSTGGGIKVSRFLIVGKTVRKEIGSYIHPKSIKKIRMDGKAIEHEVVRSTNVYFMAYIALYCLFLFLISLEGMDLESSFTAVAATFNNIGPGLGAVGPTCNFGGLTVFSKWVLSFAMLAGRLEIFPMLMVFHPTLWKDGFFSRKKES